MSALPGPWSQRFSCGPLRGLKLWAQVLGAWNAVYYLPYTFRIHFLERRIKLDSFLGFSVPFSVSVAPNQSLFLLGWKQFWIAGIVLSIYMKLHNSKLHIDVRRNAWKHSDWACQMWLFLDGRFRVTYTSFFALLLLKSFTANMCYLYFWKTLPSLGPPNALPVKEQDWTRWGEFSHGALGVSWSLWEWAEQAGLSAPGPYC